MSAISRTTEQRVCEEQRGLRLLHKGWRGAKRFEVTAQRLARLTSSTILLSWDYPDMLHLTLYGSYTQGT